MAERIVRVTLPEQTADAYEAEAQSKNKTLEDILAQRLKQSVKWWDEKPLYVNGDQRRELEAALGLNLNSAAQLINAVKRLSVVSIGDVRVNLTAPLLDRIKSRCGSRDSNAVIADEAKIGLERFAGMR